MEARLKGNVTVVGVGNPILGDDSAGCLVARALRGTRGLSVVLADDIPESYVCTITESEPDCVVLVDAVDMNAPPGSVALLEQVELSLYQASTHRVPLRLIADFIRRDHRADVFVLAIQPRQLWLGAGASPEVASAVELLADLIRRAVSLGQGEDDVSHRCEPETVRC